jgi:chloramphenicol-sensitive protein RarD
VRAGSATSLFVETLLLAPLALGYIGYVTITSGLGPQGNPWTLFWLVMTGPATTIALLLFAYGVQRLRLTTIGIIQYIAPSIQFVLAVTVFAEPLNATRLLSFALIWLSLVIFTVDSVVRARAPAPTVQP